MGEDLTLQEIIKKNIDKLPKRKKRKRQRWKPIKGYEKRYDVSDCGKVRSKVVRKWIRKRTLKPYLYRGEAIVCLKNEDKTQKAFMLKGLVIDHWLRKSTRTWEIILKDGDPFNCAVSNMKRKKTSKKKRKKSETNLSG